MKYQNRNLVCMTALAVMLVAMKGIGLMPAYPLIERTPVLSSSSNISTQAQVMESFGKMPLHFIENQGQIDTNVDYYIQGSDESLYFDNRGITFVMSGKATCDYRAEGELVRPVAHYKDAYAEGEAQSLALRLEFVGSDPQVNPVGKDLTSSTISYFKGARENWKTGLKTYSNLVYSDLWPGIDLLYTGNVNQLKYTFLIKPGADPDRIKLAYHGASAVKVDDEGRLEVTTQLGSVTDEKPYSYQDLSEGRVEVPTRFALDVGAAGGAASVFGFKVGDYDKDKLLVLDPATLIYAGFIGSTGDDHANAIAFDFNQNAYITGATSAPASGFPNGSGFGTLQGYNQIHNGKKDAFVVKLNKNGSLAYATFIGGRGDDEGKGIAVEIFTGEAFIVGSTGPDDGGHNGSFPFVIGPDRLINTNANDASRDAFVAKLNPAGTSLLFSGFIGGIKDDDGRGIAIDNDGHVYVTGTTSSDETTFPTGEGFVDRFGDIPGVDHTFGSGAGSSISKDAFVAKVNFDGSFLHYATYVGGEFDEEGHAIAVDSEFNAYVTGLTQSVELSELPTPGAGSDLATRHTSVAAFGTVGDAFIVKLADGGEQTFYAGFISGKNFDVGNGIAVDSLKNAYVTGTTSSSPADGFPAKVGPSLVNRGNGDAFVAKVDDDGASLVYAGYIGGSGDDQGFAIGVDSHKNAHIAGFTTSSKANGFPVANGLNPANQGGGDAFVSKVRPDGAGLLYSGFIGGSGRDAAMGIAVTASEKVLVAGVTASAKTFPIKNAPDLTHNGLTDAFVAMIIADGSPSSDDDLAILGGTIDLSAPIGGTVIIPITVRNSGPNPANDITLTVSLHPSLSAVGCSVHSGQPCQPGPDNSVKFSIPALGISSAEMVLLQVKVNCSLAEGTVITSTATVSSSLTEANLSNNTATIRLTTFNPSFGLSCPPAVAQSIAPGQTSGVVDYALPQIIGNCMGATVTCDPPSGSAFPLGTTTVNCSASNSAGATASCSFSVTVSVFEICLQDESSGSLFMFSPVTKDYQFSQCDGGGFTLSGRVEDKDIVRRGSSVMLSHAAGDRRIMANHDSAAKTGGATVQVLPSPPGTTFTVMDRDTDDNTCRCP